jgi:hypothetical protein
MEILSSSTTRFIFDCLAMHGNSESLLRLTGTLEKETWTRKGSDSEQISRYRRLATTGRENVNCYLNITLKLLAIVVQTLFISTVALASNEKFMGQYSYEVVFSGEYSYDVCVRRRSDENGKTGVVFLRESPADECAGPGIGESYSRKNFQTGEYQFEACVYTFANGGFELLGEMPVARCQGL